ncbi:MAG: hypothetical protein M1829_003515 [Trizodia sp. TS-e1964]|nr:MAG: hypothetical protein M1829_003515 [Trizodia sp. TS-e1964]
MASRETGEHSRLDAVNNAVRSEARQEHPAPSPVEMSNLDASMLMMRPNPASAEPPRSVSGHGISAVEAPISNTTPPLSGEALAPALATGSAQTQTDPAQAVDRFDQSSQPGNSLSIEPVSKLHEPAGLTLTITLLLTTGSRHPYRIDDKYLKKRNVETKNGDPLSISVYTLKELILREWRDEWETRPSSPSAIRLIFFGRLLDDNAALEECRLNKEGTPNVIHMTVKPQDAVDEEEATKKAASRADRDGNERTPGCRCLIL